MPTPREKTLFLLVLLFGTFFIGGFLYAWTNPSQAPPGGNVAAPLNAGSGAQSKSGNLSIGGTLNVTGTASAGANFVLTATNNIIRTDTADGSDNKDIRIVGGGAYVGGGSRGAEFIITGNETSNGSVFFNLGDAPGAAMRIRNSAGSDAFVFDGGTGTLSSATQYRVAARSGTSTQTLSHGTNTSVTFPLEDFDIGGMHSTASNTHLFTIPTGGDGVYLLIGTVLFDSNSTGGRLVWWEKQGVGAVSTWAGGQGANSSYTGLTATAIVALAGGDQVFLNSWQNSGGNLNIGDAAGDRRRQSEVQIIKLW